MPPLLVLAAAAFLAAALLPPPGAAAALSPDFYRNSCPDLESIVRYEVNKKKSETVVTIPATLRLVFHDCMTGVSATNVSSGSESPLLFLLISHSQFLPHTCSEMQCVEGGKGNQTGCSAVLN